MPYQMEMKAVKLLQEKAKQVEDTQQEVYSGIKELRTMLNACGADTLTAADEVFIAQKKEQYMAQIRVHSPLTTTSIEHIYAEAELAFPQVLHVHDILNSQELQECTERYNHYLADFNKRYSLDAWDYAIASGCGLFAAMLDILFVSAPPKPTVKYTEKVDGVFNQWVQNAFNTLIPPDVSEALSKANTIGSADTSTSGGLITDLSKPLSPMNHRLRSLSHDPILGFIFGIIDMMRGTCTIINDGKIVTVPTTTSPTEGNVFQLLGRMLGHLLSDVNAPSAAGNRGMGLPAPFMGILRMFDGIKVPKTLGSGEMSTLGKQIEWMYVNGYDFRQFVVTSIPMTIMEVMLRAFYVVKQMHVYDAKFGETLLDTTPMRLNPRFRIMLALAYGTSSAVNAGKVYITQNLLNANYASWMGFAWNGFHALRWALWDKHMKFWDEVTEKEIAHIESTVEKMQTLAERAATLPYKV